MKTLFTTIGLAAALVASPAVAQLVDGSFETQGSASMGNTSYCYLNSNCAGGSWTSVGGGGGFVGASNGDWPGAPGTVGDYHGFIQGGGSLFQTFTADTTGTFALSFLDAGRSRGGYNGPHTYVASFNGFNIFNGLTDGQTTAGQTFTAQTSSSFRLVAGQSYTIGFVGDYNGTDSTSFIDGISLAGAVPEPATWALMIVGFGAVGGSLRRRRSVGGLATA
ncbi:PEPxxWA-CTERM sorting domain-containing protein [Sphingomonas sp.]|uniref:PEPxxWA-CTERM sorting domain-containing protein n=1 Tax=Sphingomonas sp. TaxID=28214 RepID=UPI003AFFF447